MGIIINLILMTIAVGITAYLTPGIILKGWWPALVTAVVLGLLNSFLKPFLIILTLPVTFITLGLFLFVINAGIVLIAGKIVPGFAVKGFWPALLFSLILTVVSYLLYSIAE